MKCPFCSALDSRVVNSRASDDGASTRRRRECLTCKRRFTTYECARLEPLMVLKRNGERQAFNPDKLLRGLTLASEKRPIELEKLRVFAYTLEDEMQSIHIEGMCIESKEIGRRAMDFLRSLDAVAYIRFVSVHQKYDKAENFLKAIQDVQQDMQNQDVQNQKQERSTKKQYKDK